MNTVRARRLLICALVAALLPSSAMAAKCLGDAGGIESLCPLPDTPRPKAMESEMARPKPSADGTHEIFQAICGQCHDWNIVVTSPKKDWTATISNMKHNGANIPDEHRRIIIEYLNRNYSIKKDDGAMR